MPWPKTALSFSLSFFLSFFLSVSLSPSLSHALVKAPALLGLDQMKEAKRLFQHDGRRSEGRGGILKLFFRQVGPIDALFAKRTNVSISQSPKPNKTRTE
jgi:hypothetical protein